MGNIYENSATNIFHGKRTEALSSGIRCSIQIPEHRSWHRASVQGMKAGGSLHSDGEMGTHTHTHAIWRKKHKLNKYRKILTFVGEHNVHCPFFFFFGLSHFLYGWKNLIKRFLGKNIRVQTETYKGNWFWSTLWVQFGGEESAFKKWYEDSGLLVCK